MKHTEKTTVGQGLAPVVKKALSLLLAMIMLFSITASIDLSAYAETSGDYEYEILDDGTVAIIGYNGMASSLSIPSSINGKQVTKIEYTAFEYCESLKNVTIPNCVTSIGAFAFENCKNLINITIPNSITSIGRSAFDNTGFYNKQSNWSNGVLYLGNYLIEADDSISGAYTIKSGTTVIAEWAFSWCTSLTGITIPNSVTSIGDCAFLQCISLKSVTIGNGVTSIGYQAFFNCENLKSITIPNSVTSIGDEAFINCSNLKDITVLNKNAVIMEYAFGYEESYVYKYYENFRCSDDLDDFDDFDDAHDGDEDDGYFVYDVVNKCEIKGYKNSTAEKYAQENHIAFVTLCEHTYDAGKVTKVATCTAAGTKKYTCTKCKATKTETIKAIGHTYDKGKVTKAATCTAAGTKTYTCTKCKATKKETIKATGHSYKTTVTKATTKKNGSSVTKCTKCGNVSKKSTIYYPKTVTLSTISYTYDGKVKKPTVTVKDSNGKKIAASNYTVTYPSGRKNVGTYKVTIKFKGNYSGTVTKNFTIKPKATTLSSVTAGKKKFTVKWKKQATQTTGYQIQYSTDKNFKKNNKTVTVSKNSTTSKSVSKLTAKKKYYVRIRTYKTVKVNGKNTQIYSSWSKSKLVTTK